MFALNSEEPPPNRQLSPALPRAIRTPQFAIFLIEATFFLLIYALSACRLYNIFHLQNFDYGILFNSTDLLSRFKSPYLTTRGVYAWADNQDYFQLLLAPLQWLSEPHYYLLCAHAVGIWLSGVICFFALRTQPIPSLLVPAFVWLSPLMINMNLDLFHPEAFATTFILLTYLSASSGRPTLLYLCLALALACKEDVAITTGTLFLLARYRPDLIRVSRKHLNWALALSLATLLLNQGLVMPAMKRVSCEWLSSDFALADIHAEHPSLWFRGLAANFANPDFYKMNFLSWSAAAYLAMLLWPIAFTLRKSFPFWLLPLPGALINLIGGSYLISGHYHYDHSTFAGIIVALLATLPRVPYAAMLSVVLFLGSLAANLHLPLVRLRITEPFHSAFWQVEKDPRTRFVETLAALLPADCTISADHSSINYLLKNRDRVYMFDNPFFPHYFGIYGSCDGETGSLNRLPKPDLVILSSDVSYSYRSWFTLHAHYLRYDITLSDGGFHFLIFLRRESPIEKPALRALDHISLLHLVEPSQCDKHTLNIRKSLAPWTWLQFSE